MQCVRIELAYHDSVSQASTEFCDEEPREHGSADSTALEMVEMHSKRKRV